MVIIKMVINNNNKKDMVYKSNVRQLILDLVTRLL